MPRPPTEFLRRAETASSALSPATSVASTQPKSDGIPEIGGSEGGFIGLVVGLGVIFIGSCIGVFFLLRNYKHGGRTVPGKSGEVGIEAPPQAGFPRRRGTLFGFRDRNAKRAGWVRAPGEDEDDWDANDTVGGAPYDPGYGDPVKLERSAHNGRFVPYGEVTVPNLEYAPRDMPERRKDESSVDLQAPGHVPEDEPFEPPVRSASPATIDDTLAHYPAYIDHLNRRHEEQSQPRQSSLDSAETAVTFPTGTKFREDF